MAIRVHMNLRVNANEKNIRRVQNEFANKYLFCFTNYSINRDKSLTDS